MSEPAASFDVLVIGAGPAGQKAAVQAAKAGRKTLLVERSETVGGECVHRGTIPSKTLRQIAMHLASLERVGGSGAVREIGAHTKLESLVGGLDRVLGGTSAILEDQLRRNGVVLWRGHARFLAPDELEIAFLDGTKRRVHASIVVVATGSRPRKPGDIDVDHDAILDSDSILSLIYLPRSLIVLGAGVIACEFASIFQALGTEVTLVDKSERPLAFLDRELTDVFVSRFTSQGGRFFAGARHASVESDGMGAVHVALADGRTLHAEKCLVALGRVANLRGLALERAGLAADERGNLPVDQHCRTKQAHIYAVGDAIGPPSLAASAMEQGRRAMRHALGMEIGTARETLPTGIYTIPEMACVGLGEEQAAARHGGAIVGRARFGELMRGRINGDLEGLLKLVADPSGHRLLGAHAVGEGASDLVHLAQIAMIAELPVEVFVDSIFNFPTLAEAYRVAALDLLGRATALRRTG